MSVIEPIKAEVEENTTLVVDLDCGTGGNTDIGTDICVVRDKDENGLGEDTEKPSSITLTLGDELTSDIDSTQGGKLEVGDVMPGDDGDGSYFIRVSDDEDPSKTDKLYFSGDVDAGESFTADGVDGSFGAETFVHIFSSDGGTLLQTINFHTSCSVPLVIGDQYGSVSLTGAAVEGKDSGMIYQIGSTEAAGDEGVSYSVIGGDDAALFQVDADTGEVSFINPPDYENPQDVGGDNNYSVIIRATRDDGTFEDKPVEVCVEDDCIKFTENDTTIIVDLDCGTGGNTDIGTDICVVRDKDENGLGEDTEKPSSITLTLGDELTSDIDSTQGGKLEVGDVMPGDDGDGSYFIRVSDDEDPSKTDKLYFSGDVDAGESFTADGVDGSFGAETFVHIFSSDGGTLLQTINFHTSCSVPLVIGDQYGSVSLTGAAVEGKDSGTIYQIGSTEAAGDEGVSYAIKEMPGSDLFEVNDDGEVSFITPPDFENPQGVNGTNNYEVVVLATSDDGTVTEKLIEICVEDELDEICVDENTSPQPIVDVNLTVSCPVPGADEGTDICAVRKEETNSFGEDTEKPGSLTLTLGDELTSDIDSTQGGKLEVGDVMPGDDGDGSYYILVSDDEDPSKTDKLYFSGDVDAGESFTADGVDGKFGSETFVHIFSSDGGTLLQTINFHTSCSVPLVIGDQYGSVSLTGAAVEGKDSGTIYELTGTTIADLSEGDITYSLNGPDADLFNIDGETGEITFKEAPDFENPQDAGGNNVYDVTVRAEAKTDPSCFTEKPLEICVEDVPDLGSLSGRYFCDTDNDSQDNNNGDEPGVAGVLVTLLDAGGNSTGRTTTTDANGNYSFTDLVPGSYGVAFTDPDIVLDGKTLVASNVGDDASDSDAIGDTTSSSITGIVVNAGADTPDNDAGVEYLPGALSGTYFCDDDRDGVDDGATNGDADIAGKTVTLLNADGSAAKDFDGNPVAAVLTDAEGNYRFDNLAAGDYKVMFEGSEDKSFIAQDQGGDDTIDSDVDPATGMTGPVTVNIGEETTDVDAGVEYDLGSLSGRYFCDTDNDSQDNNNGDEPGVAGVLVTLLDAGGNSTGRTTTTDANGNYSFTDLVPGSYGVAFTDPDIVLDGKTLVASNVGDDASDSDAIGDTTSSSITGIVVNAGADTPDNDAGVEYLPGALSGTYFCDDDRDGVDDGATNGDADIAGKTVTLLNADGSAAKDFDGNPVAAVLTDAEGNYRFDNLAAGDYKVMFEGSEDKSFIAQDQGGDDTIDSDVDPATGMTGPVTVNIGEETTDVDAGVEYDLGSLSGRYFCDTDNDSQDNNNGDEPGVAGVLVTLLDAGGNSTGRTTTTDANGNYSFTDLVPGSYGVAFTDPDIVLDGKTLVASNVGDDASDSDAIGDTTSSSITGIVVNAGADTPDNDAGVEYLPGALSGTYFCDDDRDGVDDGATNGDADIAGKTVTLLNADGSAAKDFDGNPVAAVLTDAEGNYRFDNLAAGDYKVMFEGSEDKSFIAQDQGGDDTIDSDVDPATGMTGPVTVNIGEETTDVDAGVEYDLGSLSGRYFCDTDNDSQDNNNGDEPGVAGVLVTLLDAGGNSTGRTTTTDANGNYSFTDLVPGSYGVAFTDPDIVLDGKTLVASNVGDDASDSDAIGDTTSSSITGIVVNAGADTPDNDAGVEYLPGALSGRYFCDDDRDGLDNDGPDNGVEGVTVELLNADGTPIGRTTTTGANGNYSFLGLLAGTYGVKFTDDVSGKILTIQNVDGDVSDDIDSDALGIGNDMSVILGIEVVNGADTSDNDAGVYPNEDPEPNPDLAAVCSDEAVTINVLDNDVDPEDSALSITAVDGQAISEGGSVTLSGSQAVVTLVGGQLVYDLSAVGDVYDGLSFGSEAFDGFTYTIADTDGAIATSDVDVKVCGSANSLLTDGIPASISYEIFDSVPGDFAEAFTVELSSTDSRFDGLVVDEVYCVDAFDGTVADVVINGAFALATEANADSLGLQPAVGDNIDLINYILNQDFTSQDNGDGTSTNYTDLEVQGAIWELTNGDDFLFGDGGNPGDGPAGTQDNVDEILANAALNGSGFELGDGSVVAAFLVPTEPGLEDSQPYIVAFECECDTFIL